MACTGVDYEISGKDLIESVALSSKLLTLGSVPPAGFSYELFLDQNGEKISKSKVMDFPLKNGLTMGVLNLYHYLCIRSQSKIVL